jgi:aminobenzoyl-glutamate utilization protein B
MEQKYYQPDKYDTYLQQLGVDYEASGRETSGVGG